MRRVADYVLVETIGSGNHGTFFLARPPERLGVEDDLVALKVMARADDDDAFRRIANELRLFASVDCPYLVRLYDAGEQQGSLFYAMEHCADGSLESPRRDLDRAERLRIVSDAARAAHELHEVGVAHRDIKPANIMIRDGRGRLSDLGLAQILKPGSTVTGIGPIGTIEYMEPAMVQGEQASRASDVWALGVTLHRALCGRSVYGDIPDQGLIGALRHVLATPPRIDESLAADEAAVVGACLADRRGDRPATAAELADMIDGISPR